MIEAIFVGFYAVLGLVVYPRMWLKMVRLMREAMDTELEYRIPTSYYVNFVKLLDAQPLKQAALLAAGFELVGDLILVLASSGRPHIPIRLFIDREKTTCAYIAVLFGVGLINFESYTATQQFATSRAQADKYLEAGPACSRQCVPPRSSSVADAYRKHREFARTATVTFTTLNEIATAMRAAHQRSLAWRGTQPADILLDRDLRKMLGVYYHLYGRWIAKRIYPVPRAQIHR